MTALAGCARRSFRLHKEDVTGAYPSDLRNNGVPYRRRHTVKAAPGDHQIEGSVRKREVGGIPNEKSRYAQAPEPPAPPARIIRGEISTAVTLCPIPARIREKSPVAQKTSRILVSGPNGIVADSRAAASVNTPFEKKSKKP